MSAHPPLCTGGSQAIHRVEYDALASLPLPPETFEISGMDQPLRNHVTRLIREGAIERVGSVEYIQERERFSRVRERGVYQVRRIVAEAFESYEPRYPMPCGHRGIRNNHGEGYGCKAPWCDAVFDRETVEAVMAE